MMIISLASRGYDTITNLNNMDSDELLDIVEYETIKASIEQKIMKDSRNGSR